MDYSGKNSGSQKIKGNCHLFENVIFIIFLLFRVLITKESPDEKVILRDIHRTFPAHEFFKEAGGVGQESLYRISKVFNIY